MKYPFYTLVMLDVRSCRIEVLNTEKPRQSEVQQAKIVIYQTGDENTAIVKNEHGWQEVHKWNIIYGE